VCRICILMDLASRSRDLRLAYQHGLARALCRQGPATTIIPVLAMDFGLFLLVPQAKQGSSAPERLCKT
jgi:hypothetical protein